MKKWALATLGLALLIYGLVVVAYAHQTKEIGLRCAFDTTIQSTYPSYLPDDLRPDGEPQKDDIIEKIAGLEIKNWSDYLRALVHLRSVNAKQVKPTATVEELKELA